MAFLSAILLPTIFAFSCTVDLVLGANSTKCNCWSEQSKNVLARVCGADGKPYKEPCWAACAGVIPAYYGDCNAKVKLGPSCKKCDDTYDPVCGTDGVNYHNQCFARCTGAEVVTYGPCANQKNAAKKCTCEKISAQRQASVCGVDGESYGSACMAECKGVKIKYGGRCEFPELESCMCTLDDKKAVCGFQGAQREYPNQCYAACAKSKLVHYGKCLGYNEQMPDNFMRWASMTSCGDDGKEYVNKCQADCKKVASVQVYSECGGKPKGSQLKSAPHGRAQ